MESKKILVVEDEVVIAMDIQGILIDLGYKVPEIVTSGEEAIEIALELKPDLILMDVCLSDTMDGIEAASIILQSLDIPILYLTAYADRETLKRASETTPFDYILKPFEAKEIQANIEVAFYKHQMDKLVKENQQWLLAVLNSINEGVVASDAQNRIKFINPMAEVLSGWLQDEAIGKPSADVFHFMHEATQKLIENPISSVLKTNKPARLPENSLLLNKNGKATPVADSASPILDEHSRVEGAVMVLRDITKQKQLQAKLEYSSLHDLLTQLPNRTLFFNRLQQAADRAQRNPACGFAVMVIDLDRFKAINDTLGHLVGDQLLAAIAARFRLLLRTTDTVARLGGDEFVLLLEEVNDAATACRIAEKILDELKQPFKVEGQELLITASIGIVLSFMPYEELTDLLRNADIAMYRAKAEGRSSYEVFDAAMHSQARQLLQLEHDLRRAVAGDELRNHYQPIVCLATQEVISLEALVRWQKPGDGLIYPAEFIAIAEETGLINAIDQWVVLEACRQLKEWQQLKQGAWMFNAQGDMEFSHDSANPFTISVNVNLSSRQFTQPSLILAFERILEETNLDGHLLKLEVTESVFIKNSEAAADVLLRLKAFGVQICLDDFGTGYSSLSYLHKFPIDIVKIDRSFIQGIETEPEKFEIVRAIVGLCHSLGTEVTAEGIETPEQ
ncbi:MAG: EAL domain-containing protein, partial [Cyanobacteria bacterium J06636_16]